MKNRTIYDVLDKVMEDYRYEIEKKGSKVVLKGEVYIPRIDETISHKMEFYCSDKSEKDLFRMKIEQFKDELKSLVAKTLKNYEVELTDDEEMIDKLLYEVKSLKKKLVGKEKELSEAKTRIRELETELNEKEGLATIPYMPYPSVPNPWATGITWETEIGDYPGWLDKKDITCLTGDGNTSASYGTGDEVRFNTSESIKRNPKRFG